MAALGSMCSQATQSFKILNKSIHLQLLRNTQLKSQYRTVSQAFLKHHCPELSGFSVKSSHQNVKVSVISNPTSITFCGQSQNVRCKSSSFTDSSTKRKQAGAVKDKKSQESKKSNQEDGKEKKKSYWFRPENAWKIGLLSLGCGSILMCGNLLIMWGMSTFSQSSNIFLQ